MTDFSDITKLTPTLIKKLQDNNIFTVEVFNTYTLDQLKEVLKGTPEATIRDIQMETWKKTGSWFITGNKMKDYRLPEITFTTGSEAIDDMLRTQGERREGKKGGIRSGTLTEFVGEEESGKTEFVHTAIVECLHAHPDWSAMVFDTENTFSDERLCEIATMRGYDADNILSRVIFTSVMHTQHFKEAVRAADVMIKARNVKLVAVDSIMATLRSEYLARENLAERQQILNGILRFLLNYARGFNVAVIVTNQVQSTPDMVFGFDPVKMNPPTGGHIQGHGANDRVYLRKVSGTGQKRIARLIASSRFPPSERPYVITARGIEDTTDWKEESKKLEEKAKMISTTDAPMGYSCPKCGKAFGQMTPEKCPQCGNSFVEQPAPAEQHEDVVPHTEEVVQAEETPQNA